METKVMLAQWALKPASKADRWDIFFLSMVLLAAQTFHLWRIWRISPLRWSGFSLRLWKERTQTLIFITHLSKPRNRPGYALHMQIFLDNGALLQSFGISYAKSMQILKELCTSYNELSCKELISKPRSLFAPRSPGDSKGCSSSQKKEEDLMTKFASFLKQRLHNALEPILGPVACELRGQGEKVRKERERLLALEKQKLTLNLKELKRLKHRLASRFQRSHRASSAGPRRRRQVQRHRLRFPWKSST